MIWSGLLIYWANDVYRIGIGSGHYSNSSRKDSTDTLKVNARLAEGMAWHFLFMWIFAVNGILYVLYTAFLR